MSIYSVLYVVLRNPADQMSVLKPDVVDPPDYATVISFTGSTSKYSKIFVLNKLYHSIFYIFIMNMSSGAPLNQFSANY